MAGLTCPRCGHDSIRRSKRYGVRERLLGLVYVYPFRCQHCEHRFRALQWGVRYIKRVEEEQRE